MTIAEKLRLMEELERRNRERVKDWTIEKEEREIAEVIEQHARSGMDEVDFYDNYYND